MKNSWQRAWEHASVYLPVMLMATLALGTWWLVRNAPSPLQDNADRTASSAPDYVMHDFSVRQFDPSGRLQSEVTGLSASHYPHTDTLEVEAVRTRNLSINGVTTISSAQKGVSNSDASEIQLWGQAKVLKQDPLNSSQNLLVESDFLHAWTQEERIKTHLPVVITQGQSRFQGNSMDYQNLNQVIQLDGRVKGFIPAKIK